MSRIGLAFALAGACLCGGLARAAAPEPGAFLLDECPVGVGLLVDWSLWQGDYAKAGDVLKTLDDLVASGRCGTLYMYVFSDGHTACPVAGSPFPELAISDSTAALGQFVKDLAAKGVRTYAVVDLLEWHRAGSKLPDPLAGDLAELKEKPIGRQPEPGASYASAFSPRTQEALRSMLEAFHFGDEGFEGLIFDLHLPRDVLMGGSEATLKAYAEGSGHAASDLQVPPKSAQGLSEIEAFIGWRDGALRNWVKSLAAAFGTPKLKLGLIGDASYWAQPAVTRENMACAWPLWLMDSPYSVVLLNGDWGDQNERLGLNSSRIGILTNVRSGAVARPVVTPAMFAALESFAEGNGPNDELVVALTPDTVGADVVAWAKGLPATSKPMGTMPLLCPLAGRGPEMSANLEAADPQTVLTQIGGQVGIPLTLDPVFASDWKAAGRNLTGTMEAQPAGMVLAQVLRQMGAQLVREGEGWTVRELPDPAVTMGDRLQAAGRFDEAAEAYAMAIERKANLRAAYRSRGDALRKAWRSKEAIEAYAQAEALGVRDGQFLLDVGTCFVNMSKVNEAQDYLRQALEAEPDNRWMLSWVNLQMGILMFEHGDTPAAGLPWVQAAVANAPENVWAQVWLGKVLVAIGDLEAAKAPLEEALRLSPGLQQAVDLLAATKQ